MFSSRTFFFILFTSFAGSMLAQSITSEIDQFRADYKAEFLAEERSPFYGKAVELEQMDFYPPKKKYQISGQFTATPDASVFKMATYSGKTKDYAQFGWIHFKWKGKMEKIAVYQSQRLKNLPEYEDYLFIPFKDLTNDRSTYGGGRYIDMRMSEIAEDGSVQLDFNKCYNPWCAFSDGYNCPVPPKENHLEFKVKSGERKYKGKH